MSDYNGFSPDQMKELDDKFERIFYEEQLNTLFKGYREKISVAQQKYASEVNKSKYDFIHSLKDLTLAYEGLFESLDDQEEFINLFFSKIAAEELNRIEDLDEKMRRDDHSE